MRPNLNQEICLTVDGQRGRCLRLTDHVFCHTSVGANICWGQTADLQGVVLTNLVSGLKQEFMYQMLSHRLIQGSVCQLMTETKVSRGSNKVRVRARDEGILRWKRTSWWVIPSFGQVTIIFSPAHGGNWVTTGLTSELYTLVHQHHLAARPTYKAGTLCIDKTKHKFKIKQHRRIN